jgi:ATP-dependent RNA helicase DDX24/MAK5
MEQDTTEQTWEGYNLHEGLLSNFKRLNYNKPTDIQNKVLDYNSSKTDLVVQARTGEGKTLCFGIPIVDYILKQYDNYPFLVKQMSPIALIITPTRELGIQIKQHLDKIIFDKNKTKEVKQLNKDAKDQSYYRINVANVLGGFAKVKQLKILKKYNPEIIVATPGRLWEIIDNEDAYINFKNLKRRFNTMC